MTENSDSSRMPTSIVAIGVGNRMRTYMHYLLEHPERARLVAVVEPDAIRRNTIADQFNIPSQYRFETCEDFFRNPVKADAAFICTPEKDHFSPCIEALRNGYHVLLEKPVAQTYEQCAAIEKMARETDRIVCVCYVLRYHPCFLKIKELIDSGKYGRIITITHTENVGIDRATHSYVRGSMNSEKGNNPMLIAKCCHDIDFLSWISGSSCRRLSSFGSRLWFRSGNQPENSAERCINCDVEKKCPYSAVDLYWRRRQWIRNFDVADNETIDDVIMQQLRNGEYGRCVYHCDNDVVDNQVLTMQMDDGSLITLCMDVFTRRDGRNTDIKLTGGEIESDGKVIKVTDFTTGKVETFDYTEQSRQPFHAGADLRLVEDFLDSIENPGRKLSGASISDSLRSHRLCFEAERSRRSGTTVNF